MKRIVTIILAAVMAMSMFGSCALFKGPISDAEAAEILGKLLPEAAILNTYIWGDAIKPGKAVDEEDEDSSVSVYYTVSPDCPYHNTDDFMDDVVKYYSEEMTKIISQYAFENSDITRARFCNLYDDKMNVIDMQVDVTGNHAPFELTAVALPETAKVKRSTETIIEATLTTLVGEDRNENELTIRLLYENDRWRIDSYNWIAAVDYING